MARTERSAEIARPAAEMFPCLLEEDKVPQWTTGLEGYERLGSGPTARGSRFQQKLEVSGQRFTVEMEVTEYDPTNAATTAFQIREVDVVNRYAVTAAAASPRSPRASRRAAAASRGGSSSR
jgi:uncharacterized protein YndB with AHSA1/START domain